MVQNNLIYHRLKHSIKTMLLHELHDLMNDTCRMNCKWSMKFLIRRCTFCIHIKKSVRRIDWGTTVHCTGLGWKIHQNTSCTEKNCFMLTDQTLVATLVPHRKKIYAPGAQREWMRISFIPPQTVAYLEIWKGVHYQVYIFISVQIVALFLIFNISTKKNFSSKGGGRRAQGPPKYANPQQLLYLPKQISGYAPAMHLSTVTLWSW